MAYSIHQVAAHTGVSVRQIRRWKEQRLLPSPVFPNGSRRDATYTDEHIRRIERIKADFLDARLTLADLAERFRYEDDPSLLDDGDCPLCYPHSCDCEV